MTQQNTKHKKQTPQSNSNRGFKIEVTKEDIKKGLAKNCEKCPVALAVNRAFQTTEGVSASISEEFGLLYGPNELRCDFDLPANTTEFIKEFDGEQKPEPFNFYISERCMNKIQKSGFKIGKINEKTEGPSGL